MQQGQTMEQATQNWNTMKSRSGGSSLVDQAQYNAVREIEGQGLPPSMRAPLEEALYTHSYRTHKDVAWFQHIQQNPELANFVGERSDGRGGEYPLNDLANEPAATHPLIQKWLMDVTAYRQPDADWLKFAGRMSALRLGPSTAINDLFNTPGIALTYVQNPRDLWRLAQGALRAFGNRTSATRAGALDPRRRLSNDSPGEYEMVTGRAATRVLDIAERVLDVGRTLQGRKHTESYARQWMFEFGRMEALDRLNNGLTPAVERWFDRLEIPGWRTMAPDDLADAVGARMVQRVQGEYGRSGLPPALLNSSQNPAAQVFMRLGRWSVERMNNFMKDAYYPAMERGEFGPLLRALFGGLASAEAINAFNEYVWSKKPSWLTFKEWLGADDKTKKEAAAHTLFNAFEAGGTAGLMGSMANIISQKLHGDRARSLFTNLGMSAVEDFGTRLSQALSAVKDGAEVPETLAKLATAIARDNIQAVRLVTEKLEEKNGEREERLFKVLTDQSNLGDTKLAPKNTMDPLMKFRTAKTLEEAKAELPNAARSLQVNPRDVTLQSPARKFEPNPLSNKPTFYEWMQRVYGPEASMAQEQKDRALDVLAQQKRGMLEQVKGEQMMTNGPAVAKRFQEFLQARKNAGPH